MFTVKLHPDKCNPDGWMKDYKEGDIIDISDFNYNLHNSKKRSHGCMEILAHYRIETKLKKVCPTCGHISNIRMKINISTHSPAENKDASCSTTDASKSAGQPNQKKEEEKNEI